MNYRADVSPVAVKFCNKARGPPNRPSAAPALPGGDGHRESGSQNGDQTTARPGGLTACSGSPWASNSGTGTKFPRRPTHWIQWLPGAEIRRPSPKLPARPLDLSARRLAGGGRKAECRRCGSTRLPWACRGAPEPQSVCRRPRPARASCRQKTRRRSPRRDL